MSDKLGDIKTSKELGKIGTWKYIYAACTDCGKERWVICKNNAPCDLFCRSCAGKRSLAIHGNGMSGKHHSVKTKQEISRKRLSLNIVGAKCHKWKGGLKQMGSDYVGIKLHPDDFFYPMTGKAGYVMEHRLVMAKHLNRCLLHWEIVHHKNGIRSDNRLENLSLVKCQTDHLPSIHIKMHIVRLENEINNLKGRVTLLEAENILLKSKGISYV